MISDSSRCELPESPNLPLAVIAFFRSLSFFLLLGATVARGEIVERANIAAGTESLSNEALVQELRKLQARVEELEGDRPSLDSHAFQDECSSILYATKDGNFQANLGGRIEQDWLWASGDENLETAVGPLNDGVFFRRARLHAAGTLYDIVDYFAEFEFAPVDNIVFQDVWMQLGDVPWLGHIRAGHLKVPFGLENETSAKHLTFLERSAVHDAFQQEYDPGIMFWNTVMRDDVRYAAAFLRFDPRESGQSFGDGEYSFASRLSAAVWHNDDDTALVHLGVGYRLNEPAFNATNGFSGFQFRARPEIRNTPRFVDTGFFAADHTQFVGLEAAWVCGRFSAQGEWVRTQSSSVTSGATIQDFKADGFYLATSFFLTGEHRPYSRSNGGFGRIKPRRNVSPKDGLLGMLFGGAWEAKARYSEVDLGEFASGKLETLTLGLNWYLIPNAKILVDYILADRQVSFMDAEAQLLGLRLNAEF